GVAERRVDDDAAPAGLTHGERQVAVVAVEEPVALVDPAHRLERRAAQAEADAIDDRDLLPRRAHGRALGETVDDRAAGVAAVARRLRRQVRGVAAPSCTTITTLARGCAAPPLTGAGSVGPATDAARGSRARCSGASRRGAAADRPRGSS